MYFTPGDLLVPNLEDPGGRSIANDGFLLGEYIKDSGLPGYENEIRVQVIAGRFGSWYGQLEGQTVGRYRYRFKLA